MKIKGVLGNFISFLQRKLFPRLRVSKLYKKWYSLLLTAFIITTLIIFLTEHISFIGDMENRALDYRFKLYQRDLQNNDIVLVTIDDISLEFFVENGISWPWPRDFYAHIVDFFNAANARGILFDILFYEPDLDRFDVSSEITDNRFAKAMKNYNKTTLAAMMLPDSTNIPPELSSFDVHLDESIKELYLPHKGIRAPIRSFLQNTGSIGAVNVIPDNDGIVRRVPMFHTIGEKTIPQLALSALFSSEDNTGAQDIRLKQNRWYYKDRRLPVDEQGNYLINWYGTEGPQGVFQYYSFRSIIQSASAYQRGLEPVLPLNHFKDKYIIIGATAPGLRDLIPTPVSQTHPGMELWGTILNNFLSQDFLSEISANLTYIYLFLISLVLMCAFVNNPLKLGNLVIVFLTALVIIMPLLVWSLFRLHIPIISPLIVLILTFMYITLIGYVSEGKSKKEIKKAFSRYLHPQIIERLVENPDLVDLEGNEMEATMLFTDIYNFTSFSEKTDPKTLISLLNRYFETFTANILDNEGMLDKFMGDGLMAVFGTPLPKNEHAYYACLAALSHKKEWKDKKAKQSENYNHLLEVNNTNQIDYSVMFHAQTRIGINSGPVVAGNMGSTRRMDYTVIGDAVNLAARLESINKFYATEIIISEYTHNMVKDKFICRELDSLKVKGKDKPTRIFELIDYIGVADEYYKWINDYAEALYFYRKGEWDKAANILKFLASPPVEDKTSKIMLDRCTVLKNNTPNDWDGIFKLEVK